MPRSLVSISALALALASSVSASSWSHKATFDKSNFIQAFEFYSGADPSGGYVNYLPLEEAKARDMYSIDQYGNVLLKPDTGNDTGYGGEVKPRGSVRAESKIVFENYLIVTRFSHLPKPTCGAWPAWWMYGKPWPEAGEVDIIEYVNEAKHNHPAAHVSGAYGTCKLDQSSMTAHVDSYNCDNSSNDNEGCHATGSNGPHGSSKGGIYATEWTEDAIKIYDFTYDAAPADIDSDYPDPSKWGKPAFVIKNDKCNIEKNFKAHKMVFNIDFCGLAAINNAWDSCAKKTGYETCEKYVSEKGMDFKDTYFGIKDVRVYESKQGDGNGGYEHGGPHGKPTTKTVYTTKCETEGDKVVTETYAVSTTVCYEGDEGYETATSEASYPGHGGSYGGSHTDYPDAPSYSHTEKTSATDTYKPTGTHEPTGGENPPQWPPSTYTDKPTTSTYSSVYPTDTTSSTPGDGGEPTSTSTHTPPDPEPTCAANEVVVDGGCTPCPPGQSPVDGVCACPAGQSPVEGEGCACPPGQSPVEGGGCALDCAPNQVPVDGVCTDCPNDEIPVEGVCTPCPPNSIPDNGECTPCPPGQVAIGGSCFFPGAAAGGVSPSVAFAAAFAGLAYVL